MFAQIKIHKQSWDELIKVSKVHSKINEKSKNLQQLIETDYEMFELPFDNVNGFDGSYEYDNNGYLTKLLIATHQIEPIFNSDCGKIFDIIGKNNNINYKYSGAPPKTKSRCQRKAELDYSHLEWPYTQYIIDLVRCSVVFDNSRDLVTGINSFINMVKNKKTFSICKILRIKNGFEDFETISNETKLSLFHYRDLKMNVLIEYNRIRIIGEVQFLLSMMLNAKKKGHSVYSFVRNRDYFCDLNKYLYNNININGVFKTIITKNLMSFYLMIKNANRNEIKNVFMENKDEILKLIKANGWKKGEKLFVLLLG